MLPRIVEIEVHLSRVGMSESADLQVDDHKTSQKSVKEQEIDSIPFVTNSQAPLPAHETEISAQFQEEVLQTADQRLFQIAFGILILEVQEFEDERILYCLLGKDMIFRACPPPSGQHGSLVL